MKWIAPVCAAALVLASCADPAGGPIPTPQESSKPKVERVPDKPGPTIQRGKVKSISFEEFFALHQSGGILLFDARPAFFYNLGHIPGAINLPRGSGAEAIRKRDSQCGHAVAEGKTIVTYCTGTTCPDARKLAEQLSALGHPVSIFSAGWHGWTDAEMPSE